jgi:ATP-binding cassette subfamily F protein 3
VLDEPTNHLDLNSKEILENALSSYKGTVLYISHDRYFINATAERIVELTPTGANTYLGNYDFYMEKQAQRLAELKDVPAEAVADTESKQDWQKQKQEQAAKRKIENLVKKLEEDIATLEEKIDELNSQLELPEVFTDAGRAKAVFEEKQKAEEELATLYEDWEENSAKL